jgi:ABC-type microcin C transport system duplicated ATPase subunit YejF
MPEPVLEVQGLQKYFPVSVGSLLRRSTAWVKAVESVDFAIMPGETLGLIGESGCGKTTTAKLILLQEKPTAGSIRFEGDDILAMHGDALMRYRRSVQVVFQDPYSSLSPRMRVGDIISEPLEIHTDMSRQERQERVAEVLHLVGMQPDQAKLFPHEFSGGQRQRIAIARVIVLKPALVVLDEPTSALDMSVQAQIIALLRDLRQRHNLAYLFISHDLKVVRALAHRVVVLREGKIVEEGTADQIFTNPREDYTKSLMQAAFDLD